MCIDACFTQKRRKTRGNHDDPNFGYADSIFLPKDVVERMEDEVEQRRGSSGKGKGKEKVTEENESKKLGLRVPTSVLDGCNDSFKAADEKREKASTQFFADTGLMALVCHHDRVLWYANMTSPGERQHYALALLKALMENIPSDASVGVLYDIGCQLDRSCRKWDFLSEYRDRISFAISVFHAYGHQWPCQVVYHPRMRGVRPYRWGGLRESLVVDPEADSCTSCHRGKSLYFPERPVLKPVSSEKCAGP